MKPAPTEKAATLPTRFSMNPEQKPATLPNVHWATSALIISGVNSLHAPSPGISDALALAPPSQDAGRCRAKAYAADVASTALLARGATILIP
eukprot:CAMPEP_0196793530 /NCGR_PEP_ID=MMETSP1104-20130614/33115_1 /TAXON_ID=33652 /ORGANISM="Cafeteria sp., Strain Caron Lab Isolate" /LENGTH=92 /DNA_ID=CAMNT_0042163901 /DNA_START=308 /DNA_END=582 /DNA_ORIENTATION=+